MKKIIKSFLQKSLSTLRIPVFYSNIPGSNCLYLTIDDGPNQEYTPKILDLLDSYGIKASFFMVGKYMEKRSEILKDTFLKEHKIFSHTYSHTRLTELDENSFLNDHLLFNSLLQELIEQKTSIIRPPGGEFNFRNLIWFMKHNLKLIHFNINFEDWNSSTDEIIALHKKIKYKNGDIILYHAKNEDSLKALNLILKDLTGKFKFDTLPFDNEKSEYN